jgi:putative N6-adenine-specific DNA methylase
LNALSKRIKRHVTGPERTFFAATSPGLEKLCLDELLSLPVSIKNTKVVEGGVEFTCRIHDCYLANLSMRIPTRILMRVGDFKATNFRQLEKKIAGFPWELFFYKNNPLQIRITSKHSRLYHKNAISERFKKGIINRFNGIKISEEFSNVSSYPQQIFVRIIDDFFTLSMDSSGEPLYKRGIKKHGGKAPLRESIAAAALKLTGFNGKKPLIDPMCGSGTFSLEAAMAVKNIPPGLFRDFAFMGWPCFRIPRFDYIKNESKKKIITTEHPVIFSSDKDKNACSLLNQTINNYNLQETIKVFNRDLFDFSPYDLSEYITPEKPGVVLINPPYGRRIGSVSESKKLFYKICKKLEKDYKGWEVAIISPDKKLAVKNILNLAPHPLFHGGLNLSLLTGKI